MTHGTHVSHGGFAVGHMWFLHAGAVEIDCSRDSSHVLRCSVLKRRYGQRQQRMDAPSELLTRGSLGANKSIQVINAAVWVQINILLMVEVKGESKSQNLQLLFGTRTGAKADGHHVITMKKRRIKGLLFSWLPSVPGQTLVGVLKNLLMNYSLLLIHVSKNMKRPNWPADQKKTKNRFDHDRKMKRHCILIPENWKPHELETETPLQTRV